jgi:hypothetical protein
VGKKRAAEVQSSQCRIQNSSSQDFDRADASWPPRLQVLDQQLAVRLMFPDKARLKVNEYST